MIIRFLALRKQQEDFDLRLSVLKYKGGRWLPFHVNSIIADLGTFCLPVTRFFEQLIAGGVLQHIVDRIITVILYM